MHFFLFKCFRNLPKTQEVSRYYRRHPILNPAKLLGKIFEDFVNHFLHSIAAYGLWNQKKDIHKICEYSNFNMWPRKILYQEKGNIYDQEAQPVA